MAIVEELELDISGALDAIESLNQPLTDLGASLTETLSSAIEAVDVTPLVDQLAAIDAAGLTTTIDASIDAVDGTIPIEADAAAVPGEIDSSIASADTTVTIDADASAISPDIEAEIAATDTTVVLDVDSSGLEGVTADLEGIDSGIEGTEDSFSGLDATVAGTAGGLGRFGSAGLIGVGLVAGGITSLVGIATDAIATQQRFNQTFGDLADEASRVNLGGLNEDLGELAIKLGSDDEALQDAVSTLFQFARAGDLASKPSLELTNNVAALSARAVALNPNLGGVGENVVALSGALARGGKPLNKFGISLNKVDIQARAAENAAKGLGDGVSQQALSFAGSQLAAEKYGSVIKKDVEEGSKNAVIQQRSMNEQLQNFLEEAGKPLVAPFQQLLKDLIPVAEKLIPIFGELAEKLLPLFADVIATVAPPLAEFVALAADLISKVPAEAIAALAAAFLAFKGFSIASDAVSKIKDIGAGFLDAGGKMKDFFKAGGGFDGLRLQAIGAKDRIADIGRQFATLATQLSKKIIATIQTRVATGAAGGAAEGGSGFLGSLAARLGLTAGVGGLFLATLPVTIGIATLGVVLLNQDAIKNSPISEKLGDIFYDLGQGLVGDLISGFTDGINTGFTKLGQFLVEFIPNSIIRPIKEALGIASPSTVFFGIGVDIMLGLLGGIASLVGTVTSFFTGLPGRLVGAVGNIGERFADVGRAIIGGIRTGLTETLPNLLSFIKDKIVGAIKRIPFVGKLIGSPSPFFKDVGEAINEGLAQGIASSAALPVKALDGVVSAIQSAPVGLPAVAAALPSAGAATATAGSFTDSARIDANASGISIGQLIVQTAAKDQTQVGIEVARQLRAESFRAGR